MIQTKLVVPPHYGSLIRRERLHRSLDAAVRHKLVLVTAPAGWGKTTVVGSWLGDYAERHAWVALDDGDNDPVRFWRYIFAALARFDQAATDAALHHLLGGPHPQIDQALTAWLNAAVMHEHGVLVLDDYHLIDNAAIHTALMFLLDHLVPSLHVVLIGRSVPPFSLARMRVQGALLELGPADLRFTTDEIGRFVRHVAPDAWSAGLVADLDRRTEGWAVGLRVLSLALHAQPGSATGNYQTDHHSIHDYVLDDVFAAQPAPIQQFVLETSALRTLSASLCDAVRGRGDSALLLAEIERRNLFIMPLDSGRHWYRFHALFAEATRREADRRSTDEQRRERASRASQWYEAHGMLEDAIESALDAQTHKRAAMLIEHLCMANPPYFEHHAARGWIERLPRAVEAAHPTLCLLHAQAVLFTAERRDMHIRALVEAPLRLAEQQCQHTGDTRNLGAVYSLWALLLMWQGDHASMTDYARRALPLLAHEDVLWRGISLVLVALDACDSGEVIAARTYALDARVCAMRSRNLHSLYAATLILGDIHVELGALHDAAAFYGETVNNLGPDASGEQLTKRGMALVGLAAIAAERDQCADARRLAMDALAVGERLANDDVIVRASLVLVGVARRGGADAEAQHLLRDLRVRARHPDHLRAVDLAAAHIALADGNIGAARRWRSTLPHQDFDRARSLRLREMLAEARLLLVVSDRAAARSFLETCRARAEAQEHLVTLAEALVLLALCDEQDGDHAAALRTVTSALELAQVERYDRVFLDAGSALIPLLQCVAEGTGDAALYARALLANCHAENAAPSEPLTPQEMRVLDLLAAGHSNQEMAQAFVVSINTIKTQVKSIYRKLNVTNRLQAANIVRQWSAR